MKTKMQTMASAATKIIVWICPKPTANESCNVHHGTEKAPACLNLTPGPFTSLSTGMNAGSKAAKVAARPVASSGLGPRSAIPDERCDQE